MEILKRGHPEKTRIWKGRCTDCESEMSEVQANLTPVYDQRDGPFAMATCPVCKKEFFLFPTEEHKE